MVAQGQISVRANILWVALAQNARIPDSGHAARSGSHWDIRGACGGNVSWEAGMHVGHMSLPAR